MANLSKIVKISWSNYQILKNGGTVSGQTYDANAIYLIEDNGALDIGDGSNLTADMKAYLLENPATPVIYNGAIYYPTNNINDSDYVIYTFITDDYFLYYIGIRWDTFTVTSGNYELLSTALPKGSIWYGDNYNAATSLPIGSAGQVLKVVNGLPAWANEYSYTLPLATSGARGGIKIGYSATGANLPVQLSSEKAYVALTSSAIVSALGYTPANIQDVESYYLPLAGGVMTGGLTLSNNVPLNAKNTNNNSYNLLYVNNSNNVIFGSPYFGGIYSQDSIYPLSTNTYDLGASTRQWNNIYGKTIYENGTKLVDKYVSNKGLISTFNKTEEGSQYEGWYKLATVTYTAWSYINLVFLVQRSYADRASAICNLITYANSTDGIIFSYFNIMSASHWEDMKEKVCYVKTYDSNNKVTQIDIYAHKSTYGKLSMSIISKTGSDSIITLYSTGDPQTITPTGYFNLNDSGFLPLTGGTVTGQVTSSLPSGSGGDFIATRGNYSLFFGIGAGDVNRGIFDLTRNTWMIYSDNGTSVYFNNTTTRVDGSGNLYENGTALSNKYVSKTISLASNIDLNTVMSSGFYRINTGYTNGPDTSSRFNYGQLIVSRGSDTFVQIIYRYADAEHYIRTGVVNNTSGEVTQSSGWKQIAFTSAIPATNVIPATTTANKMLVSTTTSGTAKWSDWSSAGFLKTNASGVTSVDTNSYALSSHVHNFADINNRFDNLIYFSSNSSGINGGISPVGMSLSLARSACRTDFIHGDAIVIERSDDGGSTWTTANYSAAEKRALFTTNLGATLLNGNSGNATLNSKCRVTLTAQNGTIRYLYTNPRKMLINYSSPHSGQVLVEKRLGSSYQSSGAWVTVGTYDISGWSGWNEIPLVMDTLGGSETQTGNWWQLRLTFSYKSLNSSYLSYRTSASNILIFGDNDWGRASAVAGFGPISGTGHLYSYDVNANASFPATVSCTSFIEGGTSLVDKYLALSGGTLTGKLTVRAPIFGYEYNVNNNAAAFMLDKPGSNYSGIGSHAEADTIYFAACSNSGTWVDTYKQKWKFNGTIIAVDNIKIGDNDVATKTYVNDAITAAITTALNSSY